MKRSISISLVRGRWTTSLAGESCGAGETDRTFRGPDPIRFSGRVEVMRHLTGIDKALLALLSPIWLACVVLHLDRQLGEKALAWVPVYVRTDASSHPAFTGYWPDTPAESRVLAPGDRLVSAGAHDLLGAGHFEFWARAFEATNTRLEVAFTVERDGRHFEATQRLLPISYPWRTVPLSIALGLSGLLAILRGRGAPAARAYAMGAVAYSLQWSFLFGGPPWETRLGLGIFVLAGAMYQPLTLRAALMFPERVAVRSRIVNASCWLFSITSFGLWLWLFGTPLSGETGLLILSASYLAWIVCFMAVLARNYRRADASGRRQLRWVLFGFYIGLGPALVGASLFGVQPKLRWIYELSLTATVFIPICLYVAFIRYNLYDIDRLITTTIAYSLLAPLFLGTLFTLGVPAAELIGRELEIARLTILWFFAIAIAVPIPFAARWLRPHVERTLFRERFRVEAGIRELRSKVAAASAPGELLRLVGEELDGVLRPESIALYARAGEVYAPVYAAGAVVPPGFAPTGTLCALIADSRAPIERIRLQRWLRMPSVEPANRAILESLAANVVVPMYRGEELEAFLCLGELRSGEIYTRSALALLEALAERVGYQLERYDETRVLEENRALYEQMAGYVPAAVREGIVSGYDMAPGQREVTVLFVDLRGYTTLSQTRSADEIFRIVNSYTTAVSSAVNEHGGSVVEFHGDGLMAAFGAPREMEGKERAAVEAGRAALKLVSGAEIQSLGGGELSAGVGIATGPDFIGNIQSIDRKIWTVIGNTTNIAARLESLTRELNAWMVIDDTTWERAGESAADFEPHENVRLKGRSETFTVYALPIRAPGLATSPGR
jgi:class 3 adenylate cyclase